MQSRRMISYLHMQGLGVLGSGEVLTAQEVEVRLGICELRFRRQADGRDGQLTRFAALSSDPHLPPASRAQEPPLPTLR